MRLVGLVNWLNRLRVPLGIAGAVVVLAVVWLAQRAPTVDDVLLPAQFNHDGGLAYSTGLAERGNWFYRARSDTNGARAASNLTLREDGRALGPAHALHEEIRSVGSGRYSHWNESLWFSTSDGTDPRTNGRTYRIAFRLSIRPAWKLIGLLGGSLAVWLALAPVLAVVRANAPRWLGIFRTQRTATTRRSGVFLLSATLSLICGIAILVMNMFPPQATFALAGDAVRADLGHAYVASIPEAPRRFWVLKSDDPGGPKSLLRLYEDGREFGVPHSSGSDVQLVGGGRYSHWGVTLRFSVPDGSDPRSNGRVYRAQAPFELIWYVAALGWLLAGFGAAALARYGVSTLVSRPRRIFGEPALVRLVAASEPTGRSALVCLMAGAAGAIGALVFAWLYGDVAASNFDLFRFIPVSDALGYHNCATTLAATGSFETALAGWCSRRVLYPAMLATLVGVSGWSHQFALLLQAALIGGAIAAGTLAVRQRHGLLASAVALITLIAFAWSHVLGLFVTEVAGFILGLAGLSLLLTYSARPCTWVLFAGCAFLSGALTARAGALFVFPAVALWALLIPTNSIAQRSRIVLAAVAGLLLGPALQYGVVTAVGGDVTNTGANFSTSLYGLSTGTRDWSQASHVFADAFAKGEEDAFPQVYRAALANIVRDPSTFAAALIAAERDYLGTLFDIAWLGAIGPLIALLAAAGLVLCIRHAARSEYRLLAVMAGAEVLAAPLIFDSGGIRVFAATFAVRGVLAGIGAIWLLDVLRKTAHGTGSRAVGVPSVMPLAAASMIGSTLLAAMVSVATPLARLFHLPAVSPTLSCADDMLRVVARIGGESQVLEVSQDAAQSIFPLRIASHRLTDPVGSLRYPVEAGARAVPPGSLLALAVDRAPQHLGAVMTLLFTADTSKDVRQPVTLCAAVSDGPILVGPTYRRVLKYEGSGRQ